jgi:hypothetical protein
MRKKWIVSAASICLQGTLFPSYSHAQWAACGTGGPVQCAPSGNVGIGTIAPAAPLSIGGTYGALLNAITTPNFGSYGTQDSAGGYRSLIFMDNTNPDVVHVRNNQRGVGGTISLESQPGAAPSVTLLSNGNVGIETTSPNFPLDIKNGTTYEASGNWMAAIEQNTNASGYNGLSVMNAWASSNSTIFEAAMGWNGAATGYYPVFTIDGLGEAIFRPQRTEAMRITYTGLVGIGTTDPCTNSQASSITNCKLSVAGAIQAQEVVVNTGWSDYVLDPSYQLTPLDRVAAYIQEHHHLPDIPSDAEVKDKGVKVGEIESKLLAKIEELTLHMIQSEERNKELEERITKLESQLDQKQER